MTNASVNLSQHLSELRGRVLKSLVCVLVCAGVLYQYSDAVLTWLAGPMGKLVFIAPQEAFVTSLKVSLWGGLFLSSPFVIYQIWRFVASGLEPNERRSVAIFAPISFLLFAAGIAFAYFAILPIGMKLLLSFGSEALTPMITVSSYVSFLSTMCLAFGAVYQLPLIFMFLTRVGFVTPTLLARKRKIAIVMIFVVAAILTPPDPITQISMAIPLYVLYEVGTLLSKLTYRKHYKSID